MTKATASQAARPDDVLHQKRKPKAAQSATDADIRTAGKLRQAAKASQVSKAKKARQKQRRQVGRRFSTPLRRADG